MTNEVYKVFFITKGLNQKITVHIYSAKDFTTAEVYFRAYIAEEKQKEIYNLYKLGEFRKEKFVEDRCFVANGHCINNMNKWKETIKEIKEKYAKAAREEENKEQIKILFEGKEV